MSHRRHADDDLSRVAVLAEVVSGHQSGAKGGQPEAGPRLRRQLGGGPRGAVGPEGRQGQPKRPGGHLRGMAGARLLQVLGFIVALNIPVEVDGSPAQEDVVHGRPLVDDQTYAHQVHEAVHAVADLEEDVAALPDGLRAEG